MKKIAILTLVLTLMMFMSGCSDHQIHNALVDMGYAPAGSEPYATVIVDATPIPSPTPEPSQTISPSPTPEPSPTPAPSPTIFTSPTPVLSPTPTVDPSGMPKKLTLNRKKLSLKSGKTFKLKATIKPKKAKIKTLSWTSSDETVATVNLNGKVMAVKKGKAVITCTTANGIQAICEVTVRN